MKDKTSGAGRRTGLRLRLSQSHASLSVDESTLRDAPVVEDHAQDCDLGNEAPAEAPASSSSLVDEATQETLDTQRAVLVAEKQSELETVYDRHDTLVREKFHMEEFKMMTAFDPEEAKLENSPVFQEFKSRYDLFEKALPSPGPSRKTRSAHKQLLESSSVTLPPPASPISPVAPARRRQSNSFSREVWDVVASARTKAKGKAKADAPTEDPHLQRTKEPEPLSISVSNINHTDSPSSLSHPIDTFDSTIDATQNHVRPPKRLKGRRDTHQDISTLTNADSPTKGRTLRSTRSSSRHYPQTRSMDKLPHPSSSSAAVMDSASNLQNGIKITTSLQVHAATAQGQSSLNGDLVPFPTSPKKTSADTSSHAVLRPRRSLRSSTIAAQGGGPSMPGHPPPSKPPDSRVQAIASSSSTSLTPFSSSTSSTPTVQPPPFKHNIKRIKLIVRRPPRMISNPKQLPPPPKFNSSLNAFLDSYVMLDDNSGEGDGKTIGVGGNEPGTANGRPVGAGTGTGGVAKKRKLDLDEDTLRKRAREEATLLERIDKFRREGRLIDGAHYLIESLDTSGAVATPTHDGGAATRKDVLLASLRQPHPTMTRISKDKWDDIVETVTANAKAPPKNKIGSQGRSVAGQVAAKIQVYWDGHAARQEKLRLQEEKRLKALAKATIKMVTNEWKRAIFHIREQERLKLEEEERRRGHEHLDAILDQSGQILETQHGDLIRTGRSKSRSASVSDVLVNWGSEPENEGSDVAEDSEDAGEGEGDSDDDDAVREGDGNEFDVKIRGSDDEELSRQGDSDDESDGEGRQEDEGLTAFLLGESQPEDLQQQPEGDASTYDTPVQSEFGEQEGQSRDASIPVSDEPPADEASAEPAAMDVNDETGLTSETQLQAVSMLDADDLSQPAPSTNKSAGQVRFSSSTPEIIDGQEKRPGEVDEELGPPIIGDDEKGTDETVAPDIGRADAEMKNVEPTSENLEGGQDDDAMKVDTAKDDEAGNEDDANMHDDSIEALATPATTERIPHYLKPYAVATVEWDLDSKIRAPLLLRGVLRPYQHSGLEWLASLHTNNLNGILADEMGLGKTIQTIALLAHLACDRGIWGPHLIIVPTSVLLNWEMEFKKFLPGFRVLSYHGTTKRRKELRQGWNDRHHFNVCITSYTLASRDAHIFKRKAWYYMILDEAHMIKNFRSQRWNILLMFRSFRRLLLTGTPLQNNLTELWALLQFLMSGTNFANLKEFGEWFANPLEKAIEMGNVLDDETMQRVNKLHTVLRPYLLRRLKRDVEKELPSKFEHLVLCPLSKRQRFLYDEFMSRAQTREDLQSGVYQKIANILMQLRKVCNHPDLFEVRPIVTSFAMPQSAVADYEIKELLVRRRLMQEEDESVNMSLLGFRFIEQENTSCHAANETRRLDASLKLPHIFNVPGEAPPKDFRTREGFKKYSAYLKESQTIGHWQHIAYLNKLRCNRQPIYYEELLTSFQQASKPIKPASAVDWRFNYMDTSKRIHACVKSYAERAEEMTGVVAKFAFVTPMAVAKDLPRIALRGSEDALTSQPTEFDQLFHQASLKLQIAFPDPSLLQYDCGKLQHLTKLLREKKAGGHRVLLFTQMTRILDILEVFLNFHGYLYLRLDGATKIEDRQYITERFNADSRVFCFIASSRSGGVGINLTGADTVIFYDSDFNPQMDKQCEDRAHRIGQIRDVHIYRFVSKYTVEETMLRKANQKRSLDDIVIQKGEFDWRTLLDNEGTLLTKALGDYEDQEDALAAEAAAREEFALEGADQADFGAEGEVEVTTSRSMQLGSVGPMADDTQHEQAQQPADEDEEGGTVVEYMLAFAHRDWDFFRDWRL